MLIIMTVEYHEARARLEELIDAVQQGREVVVTVLGEPFGTMCLHGPPGAAPPRAWIESVVREGLDTLERRIAHPPVTLFN